MAPRTFAEILKDSRKEAGLSQTRLAKRAGLTGSYISLLESKRRPPPSPRVIRNLSRVLGIDPGPLLEAAALERSPPTVRKRLERMSRERGKVHRSRDRLLTTTLFHLSRRPRVVDPMGEFLDLPHGQQALLGRLLGRIRRVRNLEEAETRAESLLEDASSEDRDALARVLPRVLTRDDETDEDGEAPGDEVADEARESDDTAPPLAHPTVPVVDDPKRRDAAEESAIRRISGDLDRCVIRCR